MPPRHSSTAPWSNVPIPLLYSNPVLTSQVRYNSTNARTRTGDPMPESRDQSVSSNDPEHGASFTPSARFQSLRELFEPEQRPRYSRPREATIQQESPLAMSPSVTPGKAEQPTDTKVDDSFLEASTPPDRVSNSSAVAGFLSGSSANNTSQEMPNMSESTQPAGTSYNTNPVETASGSANTGGRVRIHPVRPRWWRGRLTGVPESEINFQATHRANRYKAARSYLEKQYPISFNLRDRQQPDRTQSPRMKDPQRPWGLSPEDMKTVDSFSAPDSTLGDENSPLIPERRADGIQPETKEVQDGRTLTHVTSSGEAHMVDVGSKPDSRRVAIAVASVTFCNPEPFRLIFENNNKKGDVLGVARIAGIMAAKRTSDLIPLCHPISISKVEVDLKLEPPPGSDPQRKMPQYGGVSIRALVECTGRTGRDAGRHRRRAGDGRERG